MSDDAEKNEAPPEQEQHGKEEEEQEQEQKQEPKLEPEPEPEPEPEKPQKPEEPPKSQPPPQTPPAPEVPASPVMVTVTIEEETVVGLQENGEPLGLRAGSAEELGSTPDPPTSPPARSKSASLNDLKPQNSINGGPQAPRKSSLSGSQVHLAGSAGSPRASLSRQASAAESTIGEAAEKPRDYVFLAALSCFCPIWPINIVAFVYSVMSRISFQQGDIDGARRLARVAKLLSIVALVGGGAHYCGDHRHQLRSVPVKVVLGCHLIPSTKISIFGAGSQHDYNTYPSIHLMPPFIPDPCKIGAQGWRQERKRQTE
ncbi:hypothetical protein lerEdw1_009275 [Lerista edwardsae]|nr:hypothetical protein lerEdw1_009275 [Lerista edwardsae]